MLRWDKRAVEEKLFECKSMEKTLEEMPEITMEYVYKYILAPRFLRKMSNATLIGKKKKYFDNYVEGKKWRGSIKQGTLLQISPFLKEAFDELMPEKLRSKVFDGLNGTMLIYKDNVLAEKEDDSWGRGRKYKMYECVNNFDGNSTTLFSYLIYGISEVICGEGSVPSIDDDYYVSEQTGQVSKLAKTKINDLYSLGVLVEAV